MFKKFGLRICLVAGLLLSSIAYNPNLVFGRVKERVITFSGTGHGHSGGSDGKLISVGHSATTGQTTDDHHAKSHAHDGVDGSGTVDGGNVVNTPAGDVAATDVQGAIDELDTEKIPLAQKGSASGVATLDSGTKIPN